MPGLVITGVTSEVTSNGVKFQTVVTVRNVSDQPIPLEAGGCPITVRLYATATRSGAPVFDQAKPVSGRVTACAAVLFQRTLAPHESQDFTSVTIASELLAGGVRPGHYFVEAAVALNRTVGATPAGELDLRQSALPGQ